MARIPKVKPLVKRNISIKKKGDVAVSQLVKKGKKAGFSF